MTSEKLYANELVYSANYAYTIRQKLMNGPNKPIKKK